MQALLPDGHGSVVMGRTAEPATRDDEVLVAVEAFALNRGETFLLERPRPGWRPGKDVAGVVVRAAADGTGPAAGQRVVAHPPEGGWAQFVAVPATSVAVIPGDMTATCAAALPLAGLTALRLLRRSGPLGSRRVLLTGASGGVGHFLVELAAAQGAAITAVTRTPERGARLQELGAIEVVSAVEKAEGPFDVVVESVGGAVFAQAWSRLSPRGLFLWLGQASLEAPTIDFFDWRGGASATMRKFDYADADVSAGEDLATLVRLVSTGRLHPELGRVDDWQHTPAVLDALLAREIRGKAILEVDR
jgi:NADPH:quinone reductase